MTWRTLSTIDMSLAPEAVKVLQAVGELDCLPADRKLALERIANCDAYLASASVRIDREFLTKAPQLIVIGSPSTGTDHMDLSDIHAAGIEVFDISKEYALINSFSATSELAFGLLLTLVRKLQPGLAAAERGDWARERYTGFQLLGKTLGILGLGRLGRISARIGNGFGMKVIANDIANLTVDGVEMVNFDELLLRSDVLTIHVHLNEDTRNLIDREALTRMKSNAILLNTSRGAVIDEEALEEALRNGGIAGAGLDVIHGEWLDDKSAHPLVQYARANENLVISPHIGGATTESISDARIFMAHRIANYLRARTAKNQ